MWDGIRLVRAVRVLCVTIFRFVVNPRGGRYNEFVKRPKGLLTGLILLGLSVALIAVAVRFVGFCMSSASGGRERFAFYEVVKGARPQTVAADLAKLGVVSDARLFRWYGRLTGKTAKIKAGDYRLSTKMRPAEVMGVLTSGVSFGVPLTIPEGNNVKQVAALLEDLRPGAGVKFTALAFDRRFAARVLGQLGLVKPPHSLEGYLYPDTYFITRTVSEEEVIRQMTSRYRAIFTEALSARARELGFTEHQVVTLASIIEKETSAPQERSMISSVFHNRLRKRMRLQSDPTVIYGIPGYDGNIRRKDLETKTPYNTYVIYGLPPGPIGNPGRDAIFAALYPAESPYLYFVSHNDGTHEFTTNYADHIKAVARYQLDRRAREGKSWRDLNKKAQKDEEPSP